MKKNNVCLNMIVRNESHVIQRCLSSVKDLIDYWVIVDTGSTDGTQEVIRQYMHDIPGELHERPWVNFGHNRNEALALARSKADYILFIDADDRLIFLDDFVMPYLDQDCYLVLQKVKHVNKPAYSDNYVVLIIKDLPDFAWEGALHEALTCNKGRTFQVLPNIICDYLHDGSRSVDPDRFDKDVRILKQAVLEDPTNARNVFFLAQTYRSIHKEENFRLALEWYEKRAVMGGREDEVFYSLYCIGLLQRVLNFESDIFIKSFCLAHQYRTIRSEPLYALAGYYIATENYWLGYQISKLAMIIPCPIDLFVEAWIYDWGFLLQFYVCAQRIGEYPEALDVLKKLLAKPTLPLDKYELLKSDLAILEEQAKSYLNKFN